MAVITGRFPLLLLASSLFSVVHLSESFVLPGSIIRCQKFGLFAVPDEPNTDTTQRRKKKNKYANFSNADKMQADPFQALINESEQKNKDIKNTIAKKKNQQEEIDEETLEAMKLERRERNKRFFPDNKTIDPYDPTTYGYIELGTILGPHGVYGLCKIAAVTNFPERLCKPGIRHLKAQNRRSPREIRLVEGRHRMKNEYLIKFEGVGDRNEALKLRGYVLYARQEERPEDMGEDEYLVTELIGLDVHLVTGYGEDDIEDDDNGAASIEGAKEMNKTENENNREDGIGGKFVGSVGGVILAEEMCSIPGLGQDLLEIVLPRGRHGTPSWRDEMVLIPLVPSIVPTVDLERRIIYIDPPSGLLDLTYVKEETVRIKGFLPEKSSYEINKYK